MYPDKTPARAISEREAEQRADLADKEDAKRFYKRDFSGPSIGTVEAHEGDYREYTIELRTTPVEAPARGQDSPGMERSQASASVDNMEHRTTLEIPAGRR